MEEQTCECCQHFHQHYGRQGNKYYKVHCGHCSGIHIKKRTPDQKTCEYYTQRKKAKALT